MASCVKNTIKLSTHVFFVLNCSLRRTHRRPVKLYSFFFPITNMYQAIVKRRPQQVLRLIKSGKADVNDSSCCDGFLPLALAAKVGFVGMAKVLLKKGALIDGVDDGGPVLCPLTVAVIAGKYKMCEFLVKHGARTDVCNRVPPWSIHNLGRTEIVVYPLFGAMYFNKTCDIIELLLEHGANPNLMLIGISPLQFAASINFAQACELLIAYGADVTDIYAKDGLTAYERAVQKNNRDSMEVIWQYIGGKQVKAATS